MTYQRLLLIVLFDSTRTIASSLLYELGSNKDERVFRVRLKTWIITDCMYTVHYHATTWCYLCSMNQYTSFGTPQAYSGGNKKICVFSRKTPITRDKYMVKTIKIVFSEISESIRFFWYPISIVYD